MPGIGRSETSSMTSKRSLRSSSSGQSAQRAQSPRLQTVLVVLDQRVVRSAVHGMLQGLGITAA
jgi:hypothetical protein